MFWSLCFLWNATRGARFAPWRSPYIRWRIETYSGMWADGLTCRSITAFAWSYRRELLSYLRWTGSVERAARHRR